MGIAESVLRMREERERLRAKLVELTQGFSIVREGLVNSSDFPELRGMAGRHEAEITTLRQARFDMSATLLCGPAEGSRAPVPVYSGDCSTLSNFFKFFRRGL